MSYEILNHGNLELYGISLLTGGITYQRDGY